MRNERRYLSTRFCSFCSKCAVRFPQKTRLQLRVSLNSDEKAQKEKRHLFQKSKRYCEIRVRLPHFFSARCFHFPICLFVSAKGLPKSHGCFPEDRDGRALLRKTTGGFEASFASGKADDNFYNGSDDTQGAESCQRPAYSDETECIAFYTCGRRKGKTDEHKCKECIEQRFYGKCPRRKGPGGCRTGKERGNDKKT